MSHFDEQPDADPHGECAAEIHRLQDINARLLEAVQAFMALDASFSTICTEGLAELAAKRGKAGDMPRAVQKARAAIAKAGGAA